MSYTDWLAAVIARPADPATRAAFLDWLAETAPDLTDRQWWRDFTEPDGWWEVEATDSNRDRYLVTVLKWGRRGTTCGLEMGLGSLLPPCRDCGGQFRYGNLAHKGGWFCDVCAVRGFDSLVSERTQANDGTPATYDDIPF